MLITEPMKAKDSVFLDRYVRGSLQVSCTGLNSPDVMNSFIQKTGAGTGQSCR